MEALVLDGLPRLPVHRFGLHVHVCGRGRRLPALLEDPGALGLRRKEVFTALEGFDGPPRKGEKGKQKEIGHRVARCRRAGFQFNDSNYTNTNTVTGTSSQPLQIKFHSIANLGNRPKNDSLSEGASRVYARPRLLQSKEYETEREFIRADHLDRQPSSG